MTTLYFTDPALDLLRRYGPIVDRTNGDGITDRRDLWEHDSGCINLAAIAAELDPDRAATLTEGFEAERYHYGDTCWNCGSRDCWLCDTHVLAPAFPRECQVIVWMPRPDGWHEWDEAWLEWDYGPAPNGWFVAHGPDDQGRYQLADEYGLLWRLWHTSDNLYCALCWRTVEAP